MKFEMIVSCLLAFAAAKEQVQCSSVNGQFECYTVLADYVCPSEYYKGLPSCVGTK